MACVHAMALGAVWIGGLRGAGEPTTEGGHILVTLMPEPVALPGEAKEGANLRVGQVVGIKPILNSRDPGCIVAVQGHQIRLLM